MFSCEIRKIFKNTHFEENLRTTASDHSIITILILFKFSEVTYEEIVTEVNILHKKKPGIFSNIPSKRLKASGFCNSYSLNFG